MAMTRQLLNQVTE